MVEFGGQVGAVAHLLNRLEGAVATHDLRLIVVVVDSFPPELRGKGRGESE